MRLLNISWIHDRCIGSSHDELRIFDLEDKNVDCYPYNALQVDETILSYLHLI